MWSAWWRRRLAEEEERVLEELMRRSEWKVFAHSWEEAPITVESTCASVVSLLLNLVSGRRARLQEWPRCSLALLAHLCSVIGAVSCS